MAKKMKVLVGSYTAESNAHVGRSCDFNDFYYRYGDEMIEGMHSKDLFEEANIELIPTILANGHAQGRVTKYAFEFIKDQILKGVKDHIHEIDGIFLFLHGASNVIDLEGGSGEHFILREVRKIVGPYLPIAVVMDPHGNISEEFTQNANLVRCYRECPHTDIRETYRVVAKLFIDLVQNRRNIHPVYRKVPIMLGGERNLSAEEPLKSINELLKEIEKSDKILSASYHIGYVRHDNPLCGAGVTVTPSSEEYMDYAEEMAEKIKAYAFSRRRDFKFTGNALEPDEALESAFAYSGKPVVVTDSGDNTTAGALGYSTFILRQLLERKEFNGKKILIAAITDPITVSKIWDYAVRDAVCFELGMNDAPESKVVPLSGTVLARGDVNYYFGGPKNVGEVVSVSLDGYPIDLAISNRFITYSEFQQFEAANLDIYAYDIVVIKQGYIFPEMKKFAEYSIMSLTPGATYQYTERLPYKLISRPMFPMDNI